MFLNPGRWLLYAALIAAVLFGIYRLDQSRQQIGYDKAVAEYEKQALAASEAARAKETQLQQTVTKIGVDHEQTKRKAAVAAANSASELGRLREQLANGSTAGENSPTACRVDVGRVERQLLGECAAVVQNLATEADRLKTNLTGLQDYVRTVIAPD